VAHRLLPERVETPEAAGALRPPEEGGAAGAALRLHQATAAAEVAAHQLHH